MIHWHEIGTDDEDLAREVVVVALDIAPCLAGLETGCEEHLNAIAVLKRVFKTIQRRGDRMVKSQTIGAAAVTYMDIESAFDGQPRRALRAICGASRGTTGHSRGSFPKGGLVPRIWPEGD